MRIHRHNGSCRILKGSSGFLCFAVVFAAWGAWRHWGTPRFWVIDANVSSVIVALVIKNLVWLVPMAVGVLCKAPLKWPLRSLFSRRIPWLFVFCCSCAMLAIWHTLWLITYQGSAVIVPYSLLFAFLSVCAGFTEELFFRGFLLNSALAEYPAPVAVVVTGVYFVLIHFTELMFGAPFEVLFSIRSLQLFLVGLFFSAALMRTRNLIVPMMLHTVWNIFAYLYGFY